MYTNSVNPSTMKIISVYESHFTLVLHKTCSLHLILINVFIMKLLKESEKYECIFFNKNINFSQNLLFRDVRKAINDYWPCHDSPSPYLEMNDEKKFHEISYFEFH